MARIRSFAEDTSSTRRHPTEVDATYRTVIDVDRVLFQLSTFGSDQRTSEPKVSQTI